MSALPLSPDLAHLVQVIRNHGLSSGQVRQLEAMVRTMRRDSVVGSPTWPETLDAIRARHSAATSGPWQWHGTAPRPGSKGRRDIWLGTLGGPGHVLDFAPWGSGAAQPRFWGGSYHAPASELVVHRDERSDEVAGIDNPDARFIAASWSDVQALLARVDELEAQLAQAGGTR